MAEGKGPHPDGVTVVVDSGYDTDGLTAGAQAAESLVQRARKAFRLVYNAESQLRAQQLDDLKFFASEQWDQLAIADRDMDGRPRITINRLQQFVRQVTNGLRESNLSIQVVPRGDGASQETAEVFEGIVRLIQDLSDAEIAYDTAAEHMVTIGRGYWTITAEYSDPRSWTQDLRVRRIRNPFTVYMDPTGSEVDGSDARFCLIVQDMPKDEFMTRFPQASPTSLSDLQSIGDESRDWMPEGKVRVAEFWYVDDEPTTLVEVGLPHPQNGEMTRLTLTLEELAEMPEELKAEAVVYRERDTIIKRVRMAVINGAEILDGNDDRTAGALWPGSRIPIFPVIGLEIDINGRVDMRGMIRDSKDPQRLYNYQNTALVETLALAPLAQWVGYEGQFEGHEQKWNAANRRRFPYLEVKPVTLDGNLAPLPSRITSSPPIQGIVQAIAQSDNDLKATMGLYDPSLGERGPQQSGKAITALQRQGELANSNFSDNLARALRATGRALVELIPHYYKLPRVLRITTTDGLDRTVMVHAGAGPAGGPPTPGAAPGQPPAPPPTPQNPLQGIEGIYDLSAGTYDVTVIAGPGAPTKRMAAVEAITQFIQAYPNAFPIVGDLLVKNMDWPGSQQLAARLAKMVPPQFQDNPGGEPAIPPQAAQQIQQLQQQLQQMVSANTQLTERLKGDAIQAESKMAIEEMRLKAQRELKLLDVGAKIIMAEAQAKSQSTDRMAQAEMSRVDALLDQSHDRIMQAADHAHEVGMATHGLAGVPPAPPGAPPEGEGGGGGSAPPAAPPLAGGPSQ